MNSAKPFIRNLQRCVLLFGMGTIFVSPGLFAGEPSNSASQISSSENESLIAVGPAYFSADGHSVSILGQLIALSPDTIFSRGIPSGNGAYVAVTGNPLSKDLIANDVIHLGGKYVIGSSIAYLKAPIGKLNSVGQINIGSAVIDVSNALHSVDVFDLRPGSTVEIVGFESSLDSRRPWLVASEVRILGITGSGARGITGSGARGITGSGARGITGSGARGITGSGARGSTGAGAG